MENTKKIGLCGRSGSGKGYVAKVFTAFGGYHVDTDMVYRELLEPLDGKLSECLAELSEAFGAEIVTDELRLDRRKLAGIVFSDREKLALLNKITHKYILDETMKRIWRTDALFALIDAPVLFESGFDKYCDCTVGVVANDEICIERIVSRDGIDKEAAERRLSNQLSADEIASRCDFVVVNDNKTEIRPAVQKILVEIGIIK